MIPENELGVIVLFSEKAQGAGFSVVQIKSSYPDAVISRTGISYRVEFEYTAKNFELHNHDPRHCDLIICWKDDYPDAPLPVLALSEVGWENKEITLFDDKDKEIRYWKDMALANEKALRELIEQTGLKKSAGGRPRISVDPKVLAYYFINKPDNISIPIAKRLFGISRNTHDVYKMFCQKFLLAIEETNNGYMFNSDEE